MKKRIFEYLKILLPLWIILSGTVTSLSAQSFEQCEKIFLQGKSISYYLDEAKSLTKVEENLEYLSKLKKIKESKSCIELLNFAQLKNNGLLAQRSLIASDILKAFNQFHYEWLMPKDIEHPNTCQDQYQWDIYDLKSPAYLFTRTLFQKEKKASQVVSAYGEARILTKGENLKISPHTLKSSEDYKKALGVEKDITFQPKNEILGFLYKRAINATKFSLPRRTKEKWLEKIPFKNEHNIYQHFGAGVLGSPSFLYYHLKKDEFYQSNGNKKLPRSIGNAIFEKLLCSSPEKYFNQEALDSFTHAFIDKKKDPTTSSLWNHPITKEKTCLSCHFPMAQLSAGFRNISLIPSSQKCSKSQIQIHYPVFLKSDHRQGIWQESPLAQKSLQSFSESYPEGNFKGKRFRSIRQLGALIAQDINFYSCQVKRYYQWIHNRYPNKDKIEQLSLEYQKHQNGFKLLTSILLASPKQDTQSPESM